ncbi:hypothetical protein ABMA59_23975 [Mesorhizobium sp. CN2-181]
MALEPIDAVGFAADVTGVQRLRQKFGYPLLREDAFAVAREFRETLQEALHLRLGLEAPHRITFERIADDRREGLLRHQQFAPTFDGFIAITNGRIVNPIARLHARFHLLRDLTAILLAFERALRGHDCFDELALGTVVELEVEALYAGAALAEGFAQIEVEAGIAGKPLQIVEDDDEGLARLRVEEAQKRDHARPLHEVAAAADRVREHGSNLVGFGRRVLAAAMLLANQSVPLVLLGFRRHAAVNDCFLFFGIFLFHTASFPLPGLAAVRIAFKSSACPQICGLGAICQPISTNETTIDQSVSISSRFWSSGISWSSR